MSETLRLVQTLVLAGDVRISEHGFEELKKDGILIEDVMTGIATAIVVEDYPERRRTLTLQSDSRGRPLHVVWALPAEERRPPVLVTAYRRDPAQWDIDFKLRKGR